MEEEMDSSEDFFEAHNLNPQLFLNEVLNIVDDTFEGAFEFFLQKATEVTSSANRSEELATGVSSLRNLTQAVVDKRMDMWENYCLRHCFTVPEGISLPKDQDSSGEDLLLQEGLRDNELDSQLDSLRNKLGVVGKESAELIREMHLLKNQSTLSHRYDSFVTEALQLLEQNSTHQMFQEMGKTASKLHLKMNEMKMKRREDMEQGRVENSTFLCKKHVGHDPGGVSGRLEDIQEAANILKAV